MIKSTNHIFFITIFPYILLCLLACLPLLNLFHPGLPLTHDGKDHVARIANFYQNLQQGVLIPRWAGNLNWGYGHPILMFLYPLPSYIASLFHFLGFSLIDSVKIVFGVSFIFSGFAMYLFMAKAFDRYAGFIAAILYMFAPYRFVDLSVRGAIGEHVAFIFPPLVLYFLLQLSKKRDLLTVGLGAVSLAGLLLSHNAISIMFVPIFFFYGIYLLFSIRDKKIFLWYSFLLAVLGFCLAAFFWIPALLEGKYTLRDIVTDKDYALRFVPFVDFVYGQWSFGGTNFLSKQVGIMQWVGILGSILLTIVWYKKKNRLWLLSFGSLIIFIATLFIMTAYAKVIWDHIKILQNFQFPWRFLSVIVFITAFATGLLVFSLPRKIRFFSTIILSVISILITIPYWNVSGYLYKQDIFFSTIYEGTTDTGESAPIWSVRFMEKQPKAHIEVIEGKATISENKRKTIQHSYTIDTKKSVRVRENTLYFPGWEVLIDNKVILPEFQDPKNRGLLTFYVPRGVHTIQILFQDTKIRILANSLSIAALVIVAFFCIIKLVPLWKHSQ